MPMGQRAKARDQRDGAKVNCKQNSRWGPLGAKESGSHVKEVQVDGDLFVNSTMLSILRSRPLFMLARVPVGIACSCRLKSSLSLHMNTQSGWPETAGFQHDR